MKSILLALAISAFAFPAIAADPTDAVQFFYSDPGSELASENRDRFTGKAKEVLDAADAAETDEGPCIGFMLSVDGQDLDADELKSTLNLAGAMAGEWGSVDATFKQYGEDVKVEWTLEKIGEEWKIADIASAKNNWKLSEIDCSASAAQ